MVEGRDNRVWQKRRACRSPIAGSLTIAENQPRLLHKIGEASLYPEVLGILQTCFHGREDLLGLFFSPPFVHGCSFLGVARRNGKLGFRSGSLLNSGDCGRQLPPVRLDRESINPDHGVDETLHEARVYGGHASRQLLIVSPERSRSVRRRQCVMVHLHNSELGSLFPQSLLNRVRTTNGDCRGLVLISRERVSSTEQNHPPAIGRSRPRSEDPNRQT